MIPEAELEQMRRNVEMGLDVPPGHQPVLALNCQRLLREVEELKELVAEEADRSQEFADLIRNKALEEAALAAEACCREFPACGVAVSVIRSLKGPK